MRWLLTLLLVLLPSTVLAGGADPCRTPQHACGGGTGVAEELTSSCTDAQVLGGDGASGVECQTDDDVPESGDFAAAADLDADGSVSANAVALTTDTTGNYVATIADSGASEVTVSGSGSEGAAVTLAIAASLTRDSELSAMTVSTTDVVDTTTACNDGDIYIDTDGPSASGTPRIWFCIDGATENWAYEDLTD